MDEFCKRFTRNDIAIRDGLFLEEDINTDDFISLYLIKKRYTITYNIPNTDMTLKIDNSMKNNIPGLSIDISYGDGILWFDILDHSSKFITQLNEYINCDEDFERKLLNVINIVSSRFKALTDEPIIFNQTKSARYIS